MTKSSPANGQPTDSNGITPEMISAVVAQSVILDATLEAFSGTEEVSITDASCLALAATSEYVETMRTVFNYEPTFEDINQVMASVLKLSGEQKEKVICNVFKAIKEGIERN